MVLKYEGRYELGGPLANMGVDDVLNSKKIFQPSLLFYHLSCDRDFLSYLDLESGMCLQTLYFSWTFAQRYTICTQVVFFEHTLTHRIDNMN